MPQGLPRRIRFAFFKQAVLAVLAVLFGVMVAGLLARNALVDRWLAAEADAFWLRGAPDRVSNYASGSAFVQGWFVPSGSDGRFLPEEVRQLPDGYSPLPDGAGRALLSHGPGGDLYLVLSTRMVDRVLLVAGIGLILYGLCAVLWITWATYLQSRRMVLPINRLAGVVARWDPETWDAGAPSWLPDPMSADTSQEMRSLSTALGGLAARIGAFVQRERDFTRDASHELRTPLTVVRVATDMLLGEPAMPAHAVRSLRRIEGAVGDMESLVDAFLILARERGVAPPSEEFAVLEIVREEVEKVMPMLAGRPVVLKVSENASPRLFAPPGVFAVMLGQLLSNACTFTERGRIDVEVGDDAVRVRDTGIGMSADALERAYDPFFRADPFNPVGKGFGLSIARRLGDRFGWPVSLESMEGRGTVATIRFPAAARG